MFEQSGKTPETAVSPSQLNSMARRSIENKLGRIWLSGEVSDVYKAASGHLYFSLKDQQSSVKCTFFRQFNFQKINLKNGDNLLTFGQATLYEERGTFQLKVERVEKSGIGDMAKAFAELKLKLEALGYFSPEHKQKLPAVIHSLAIVTSKTSAAITDVLNVIKRRNPLIEIQIYHASVQGDNAIEEIINALLTADINHHDAILLTRGGGSQEDLWTFNDISIAQTLFNLSTPCVSAIGHERDVSISDLVADVSAITPSAAAELLSSDLAQSKQKLSHNLQLLYNSMLNLLNSCAQKVDSSHLKLEKSHPKSAIENQKNHVQHQQAKLQHFIKLSLKNAQTQLSTLKSKHNHFDFKLKEKFERINYLQHNLENLITITHENKQIQVQNLAQNLNTLSPLATLSRGYSITLLQNSHELMTHSSQLKEGDTIKTQFATSSVFSKIVAPKSS